MASYEIKGLESLMKDLTPEIAEKVAITTLNTIARKATTQGNRALQKYYNIKTSDLKKYQRVVRARKGRLVSTLIVSGTSVPLYKFAGQSYVARTKGAKKYFGASAKPLKTGGRKRYPNTFPVVLKSGHIGAFSRTGERMKSNRKRWAIIEHRMVTGATMFDLRGQKELYKYASENMEKEFIREYKNLFYRTTK